eukprot:CAMPEP_0202475402 /NCGR_PEP_ID=MMETSP1360-20130828/92883_1 /ASSEMBLY_ACC=CAM_ASM_000848 /TAXON_ID=515479 /ORGANISM="Licmophora paradoxa, Strain CCMP2313" /LENGTH=114 /DNA_ID=CAMNT_0049102561 /DNA_START=766 /DNA_END=1110 /DNA_ORIENTATION=+
MTLRDNFELIDLPQMDRDRIALNMREGKLANYIGEAKLYVSNLSFDVTEQDLYQEFSQHGKVGETNIVYENGTGRPRGFAFITMRSLEDGKRVTEALDGAQFHGRELRIKEATS